MKLYKYICTTILNCYVSLISNRYILHLCKRNFYPKSFRTPFTFIRERIKKYIPHTRLFSLTCVHTRFDNVSKKWMTGQYFSFIFLFSYIHVSFSNTVYLSTRKNEKYFFCQGSISWIKKKEKALLFG